MQLNTLIDIEANLIMIVFRKTRTRIELVIVSAYDFR